MRSLIRDLRQLVDVISFFDRGDRETFRCNSKAKGGRRTSFRVAGDPFRWTHKKEAMPAGPVCSIEEVIELPDPSASPWLENSGLTEGFSACDSQSEIRSSIHADPTPSSRIAGDFSTM
ncbi:hypothetical protein Nepgr_004930 [Nepenthes gracilis]|uniref:Uncharacterized protein n=1 Tax=Nepenthes gracilis TaxID=150966 RepID=A0AAD3XFZ4_NEPGR|nr:hypothetical protein Nepgr_004930 [Nepenthes gracilis]